MAETDLPNPPIPSYVEDNHLISDDTTDAEHEDPGDKPTALDTENSESGDLHINDLHGEPLTQPAQDVDTSAEPAAADIAGTRDAAPAKKKGAMSVTAAGKTNGGPPTPTVKKIINSGTFGAGSVKPMGAKAAAVTSAAARAAAPPLKKATTSAPPATSRPPLASSMTSKPTITPSTASRRASVVPTKTTAPPLAKPSLSASANTQPSADNIPARRSVASPTGSVGSTKAASATPAARPRASVSEAVRKAPLTSRPSVASSTKVAAPARTGTVSRSSAAPPAKSSRATASISSIKEVKEHSTKEAKDDGKALAELQDKFDEATKSLESRSAAVSDLETQIEKLEASLATALAEVESKAVTTTELETANTAVESQLVETQNAFTAVQAELTEVTTSLQSVQKELEEANLAAVAQSNVVQTLQGQIEDLEAAVQASKEKVELLEKTSAEAAAGSSSIEHQALLTAEANFRAISEEAGALKAAHTKALQDSEERITELQEKVAATEALQAQVTSLKAEKEENANKLSELEIEILELKETQDGLEDTRDNLQRRIASLEDDLAKAAVATGLAAEASSNTEAEHAQELAKLIGQHEKELEAGSTRYAEIVAALDSLKAQHSEVIAAREQTKQDILSREEMHASRIEELEQEHAAQQANLSAEIEKISKELQSQESIYNSKVDAVKAEHAQLLQEAFDRAKNEAGEAHAQELQALRSDSNSTIEQIQAANRVALEALKAEHASSLETEVNSLSKQINNLNIELKATQDDLAKAKSALDASRAEVELLIRQRDEARAQAEAVPALSPERAEEIARLTKELSNKKDDLAAVTDMLNLTKSSMRELSDNHSKELEEAAKGRADEVLKLRSAHDAEISKLATDKSELLIKVSDLQGELATAKASLAAQEAVVPKSHGNGVTHPPASPGVTKEELTKMHEAHNLKVHDLHAEHEKAMRLAKEELEEAFNKIGELQQDLARKAMEIQYLEQDQDENQEQITRLKEDLNTLSDKVNQST